mmetsp:Transcript_23433/g.54114  ORF Transcript_23433/g.54114 Transcript_23433/m.54114 type:complete len:454 (-) Transcript_23433:50-1411(-)
MAFSLGTRIWMVAAVACLSDACTTYGCAHAVCQLQIGTNFAPSKQNLTLDNSTVDIVGQGNMSALSTAQGLGYTKLAANLESSILFLEGWFWEDLFQTRLTIEEADKLLKAADGSEWVVLLCTVVVLLCLEIFVFRNIGGTFTRNIAVMLFWLSMGLAYNVYFIARYGWDKGVSWTTGYLLEWMLSMDNLFVFHLIFQVYKTPPAMQGKALGVGIACAAILKLFFFILIGTLVNLMHWVRFVFGALLIYSGIEAVRDGDDADPSDSFIVWLVKKSLGDRLYEHYDLENKRIFMKHPETGKGCASLLFMVILCLEATDVIFAIDSVSAKVGQIPNLYIAYSSSVLAIFSLRSMFFVINDLVTIFENLKYGICVILVFIGIELICSEWIDLPPVTVCVVILSVFTLSLLSSIPKAASKMSEEDEIPDGENMQSGDAAVAAVSMAVVKIGVPEPAA